MRARILIGIFLLSQSLTACPQTCPAAPPLGLYPDRALTPGAVDPKVTQVNIQQTICKPGYTAKVRNVTAAMKHQVVAIYLKQHPDWPKCAPAGKVKCEIDHEVSLELGGLNQAAGGSVTSNLWPEPYLPKPGAREKDQVEDDLHRRVCKGNLALDAAQHIIVTDWLAYWKELRK